MDIEEIKKFIKEKLEAMGINKMEEPFIIGKFDPAKAMAALEQLELTQRLWMDSNGTLYSFARATMRHETVSRIVEHNIYKWLLVHQVDCSRFRFSGSCTFIIGRGVKEPDVSVQDTYFIGKIGDFHNNKFPTFVAEISIYNEPKEVLTY